MTHKQKGQNYILILWAWKTEYRSKHSFFFHSFNFLHNQSENYILLFKTGPNNYHNWGQPFISHTPTHQKPPILKLFYFPTISQHPNSTIVYKSSLAANKMYHNFFFFFFKYSSKIFLSSFFHITNFLDNQTENYILLIEPALIILIIEVIHLLPILHQPTKTPPILKHCFFIYFPTLSQHPNRKITGNSRTLAISWSKPGDKPRKSLPGSLWTGTPSLESLQTPSNLLSTGVRVRVCFCFCFSFFFSDG